MPLDPILLVEDQEDDVFIMQRSFEAARIVNPLVVLRDGLQAVNYLRGMGTPDAAVPQLPVLVLLDLKMPLMGGFEVLQWIRSQQHLNRLIVIILSSSRHPVDVARGYELHANSFLVKRGSMDQTVELLRSMHNYWLSWNERPDLQIELSRLGG